MKKVIITYCKPCGYLKRASALTVRINTELGLETDLIPGGGGIYKVEMNNQIVAQKTANGFPEEDEIIQLLQQSLKNNIHG